MIKREHYLNQIIDLIDKDIIKILTGVRRSGKSVLLQQVVNHLKNNGINIVLHIEKSSFLSLTAFALILEDAQYSIDVSDGKMLRIS